MPRWIRSGMFGFSLILAAGAGLAAAADAPERSDVPAGPAKPAHDPLAPPEVIKPVIPSKAEMADSAFKKLDPTGKGYVTLEDTKGLDGFDQAFRVADTDRSGKLDFQQFRRAWAQYSGYKQ